MESQQHIGRVRCGYRDGLYPRDLFPTKTEIDKAFKQTMIELFRDVQKTTSSEVNTEQKWAVLRNYLNLYHSEEEEARLAGGTKRNGNFYLNPQQERIFKGLRSKIESFYTLSPYIELSGKERSIVPLIDIRSSGELNVSQQKAREELQTEVQKFIGRDSMTWKPFPRKVSEGALVYALAMMAVSYIPA